MFCEFAKSFFSTFEEEEQVEEVTDELWSFLGIHFQTGGTLSENNGNTLQATRCVRVHACVRVVSNYNCQVKSIRSTFSPSSKSASYKKSPSYWPLLLAKP